MTDVEKLQESKRLYGYEIDRKTRRKDELFSYRFHELVHDRKKKVVVNFERIQEVFEKNETTGKWIHEDICLITFHDGTTAEMNTLDYLNRHKKVSHFLADEDIEVIDGIKYFTFRNTKYGTFTVPEGLIN